MNLENIEYHSFKAKKDINEKIKRIKEKYNKQKIQKIMENIRLQEIKNAYKKHIVHSDNVDAIFEIIEREQPELMDTYISESGKFITDTFTYLNDMYSVPKKYRQDLFLYYFGSKKSDISKKWFKKTIRHDKTYHHHLTSHILCLAIAVINEQKRRFGVSPVKTIEVSDEKKVDYAVKEAINRLLSVHPHKMSDFCVGITHKENIYNRLHNDHNVPLLGFKYYVEMTNEYTSDLVKEYFVRRGMRVANFKDEGRCVYFYRVENLTTE